MTIQEAHSIVMNRHHWSSAHLLDKEVCRIVIKEVDELLLEKTEYEKLSGMTHQEIASLHRQGICPMD